jgi:hypothetical protein
MPPKLGTYTAWPGLRFTSGTITPTTSSAALCALALISICPVFWSATASMVSVSFGKTRCPSVSPRYTQRIDPGRGTVHVMLEAGPGARATRATDSAS